MNVAVCMIRATLYTRPVTPRRSLLVPGASAMLVALALLIGYRYADLTHHRPPPPPPPIDRTWPGTTLLTGTLTGYKQRVMSLRTDGGTFAVIFAQATIRLPTCGRWPTLQPGERLAVRVPVQGDGSLMAATVQLAGVCPARPH